MANVRGAVNAVRVDGNASGPFFLQWRRRRRAPDRGLGIVRLDRHCQV